jgi:ABC-type transport system involved in multi-copper enzyme maturation permease subunit
MSPPHEPTPGPLRRLLRSDLGSLLIEFAAAVFLFVEAVLLLSSRARWPGLLQAALWAQWLALLVGLRAAGFFRLFGPILFYDLVRTARRRRHFLFRGLYTVGLLLLLCWVWWAWTVDHPSMGEGQSAQEMTVFATSFFFTFMIAQYVILAVLTPAYTAGAIAEEKDRRTLEFILASDLRDREIVLGKLSARLANLALLLFAGLPVLGFLQFLGGVDPALVVAGFLATVLTVLSLGALSICNSVLFRKPREAILFTYVAATAYLVVSGGSQVLVALPGMANFPSTTMWTSPVTVANLVDGFSAGNIVVAVRRLDMEVLAGGPRARPRPHRDAGPATAAGGAQAVVPPSPPRQTADGLEGGLRRSKVDLALARPRGPRAAGPGQYPPVGHHSRLLLRGTVRVARTRQLLQL